MKRILIAAAAALALAACSPPAADNAAAPSGPVTPATTEAPAGAYSSDPNHTSLHVRVNHFGLSRYTVRFNTVDADLNFDPANPAASSISLTVDPTSVDANFRGDYPGTHGPTYPNWNTDIAQNQRWLNASQYPEASFRSTSVTLTGANTATVTGDLTFLGQTHPVTFDATFNGGSAAQGDRPAKVGLSARGSFNRSQFGSEAMQPAPGTNGGIGDDVEVVFEGEFVQDAPAAQ